MRRSISSIHGTRSGSAPGRMIDRILHTLLISMASNPIDHQSMQYDIGWAGGWGRAEPARRGFEAAG